MDIKKSKLQALFVAILLFAGSMLANAEVVNIDGINYELNNDDMTACVAETPDASGNITLPEKLSYEGNQYVLTAIGEEAFSECSDITSVTIPESVTSIDGYAFERCTSLASVTIPSGVTSIGKKAFFECSGLGSIIISASVAAIGQRAFGGCQNVNSIVVDEGNKTYDSRNNCNAIVNTATNELIAGCKATTIPSDVTTIGEYAFCENSNLTTMTIPQGVTSIGYNAFYGCTSLTSITMPLSLISIDDSAFAECGSLTSVNIPQNVTSIGSGAFSDCANLKNVYCYGTEIKTASDDSFYGLPSDATLHVDASLVEAYKSTNTWNNQFANIVAIEQDPTAITQTYNTTTSVCRIYTTDGKICHTLQKGINVLRLTDGKTVKVMR